MASPLNTPYLGLVEENRDPERLGRLKVRVPAVYGGIGTEDLPWALPFGLPSGGSKASGGLSFLPEPGDQVLVQFLDGEPEKPCWTWLMQSVPQASTYKFRSYGKDGKPDHARFTRYGHSVELTAESVIVTNSQGYSLILQNRATPATGYIQLRTPRGQLIAVDDELELVQMLFNADLQLQVGQDAEVTVGSLRLDSRSGPIRIKSAGGVALSGDSVAVSALEHEIHHAGKSVTFLVESPTGTVVLAMQGGRVTVIDQAGSTLALDGEGNAALTTKDSSLSLTSAGVSFTAPSGVSVVAESGKVTLTAPDVVVNAGTVTLGAAAASPVALANLLASAFNTHTHSNGNNGSPTGPPIVPLTPQNVGSTTTSA